MSFLYAAGKLHDAGYNGQSILLFFPPAHKQANPVGTYLPSWSGCLIASFSSLSWIQPETPQTTGTRLTPERTPMSEYADAEEDTSGCPPRWMPRNRLLVEQFEVALNIPERERDIYIYNLYIYIYSLLSIYLPTYLSIYLSVYRSLCLSIYRVRFPPGGQGTLRYPRKSISSRTTWAIEIHT